MNASEVDTRIAESDEVIRALPGYGSGAPAEHEFAILDPATEERIAVLPDRDPEFALAQVGIADAAGRDWAKTTPQHRADILDNVYALLLEHQERLALVISREMGKTLREARGEVQYAADYVRLYAHQLLMPNGGYRENPKGGSTILTRRSPVGLSVLISPWNFPLAMMTRKVAPALAAGCAAILKPASLTPLTTVLAVELLVEAGVPRELVRVVTTTQSAAFSEAVLADARVRKVSFTGSTGVGSTLLEIASRNVVKASMELGGNAPFIVFNDADVERAVEGAFLAKMRNGGQSCIAANRYYVHDGIADEFVAGLAEKIREVRVGNQLRDDVDLGPMIDRRAVDRLDGLISDASRRGAEVVVDGGAREGAGYFVDPALLDHVPNDADVAQTEIFGPIIAVSRFSTETEVIERANDTRYGLASYVFTENLDRAFNVADAIESGLVGINLGVPSNPWAAFGGVKASGLGREGSAEGLEEYQELRFYNIQRRATA